MTRDEVVFATKEAIAATEAITGHIGRLRERIGTDFPLQASQIKRWDDEHRERLHALLRMFEQSFDLVSRRLFRSALILSGEDPAEMSARNLFRRLEKIGAIRSADRWIEVATTRNLLVHEYPTDAQRQAERANLAWDDLDTLLGTSSDIIAYITNEQLLQK